MSTVMKPMSETKSRSSKKPKKPNECALFTAEEASAFDAVFVGYCNGLEATPPADATKAQKTFLEKTGTRLRDELSLFIKAEFLDQVSTYLDSVISASCAEEAGRVALPDLPAFRGKDFVLGAKTRRAVLRLGCIKALTALLEKGDLSARSMIEDLRGAGYERSVENWPVATPSRLMADEDWRFLHGRILKFLFATEEEADLYWNVMRETPKKIFIPNRKLADFVDLDACGHFARRAMRVLLRCKLDCCCYDAKGFPLYATIIRNTESVVDTDHLLKDALLKEALFFYEIDLVEAYG